MRAAASTAVATLTTALDRDWSTRAGSLEWTCRRTLDHVPDALCFYSVHLARRARERVPFVRDGAPDRVTVAELLGALEGAAGILAALVDTSPPGTRAFHPAGMADPEGFAAMGCDEILVHTADIAGGMAIEWAPPADLAARVVARLFPWVETGEDPWTTLLWANGRVAAAGRERLAPDWWWHCAPLPEWDGRIKRRTRPPAW